MRTVEQMIKDYEGNVYYRYMTKNIRWYKTTCATQDLEDSKFVVVSILSNLKIRIAYPDWYKLHPTVFNRQELLKEIFNTLFDYDIISIRMGKQAIYVEVSEQ